MDQFPRSPYTPIDVKAAGNVILGEVPWTDGMPPEIKEAFVIANSWRESHAFPMRSIRYSVIDGMRHHPVALAGYRAAFRRSSVRAATIADYRAAPVSDLAHDAADRAAGAVDHLPRLEHLGRRAPRRRRGRGRRAHRG